MNTQTPAMDLACSVGIGDDLTVFGDVATMVRVQELFGRRDRTMKLPANSRREGTREGLGAIRMSIGRGKDGQTLTVTGNGDAMTRMQAIYLADSRRLAAADLAHRFGDMLKPRVSAHA